MSATSCQNERSLFPLKPLKHTASSQQTMTDMLSTVATGTKAVPVSRDLLLSMVEGW